MTNGTSQSTTAPALAVPVTVANAAANTDKASFAVKAGLAQMLKGGVIMDVTNAEQARIAE